MKALVTGADGFVGRWLVRHLEGAGDEVFPAIGGHLPAMATRGTQVDVRRPEEVTTLVSSVRPDAIYHLAAVAFEPDAARGPHDALEITVGGTLSVLEAARGLDPQPIVFVPSSAEVYGGHTGAGPIPETSPLAPDNVYGATKAAQELLSLAYGRAYGMRVVVARAFNHVGPGQRESFAVASFAMQLARIAAGLAEPVLRTGNLGVERDFTDVRDVVRAYRLLVSGRHAGQAYNVASGRPTSLRAIVDSLVERSGQAVRFEVDPARMRRIDVPSIAGDAGRLREATGWRPEIELGTTLDDIWADAVQRSAASA